MSDQVSSTEQKMGQMLTAAYAMAVGGLAGMTGAAVYDGVVGALLQGIGLVLLLGGLLVVRQSALRLRRAAGAV